MNRSVSRPAALAVALLATLSTLTAYAGPGVPPGKTPHGGIQVSKLPLGRELFQECHTESRKVTVLPILAVLSANTDGTKAVGEWNHGVLSPIAPYLRASAGGPNLVANGYQGDYIREWVRITNDILARSNAPFRLGEDIQYVEEKNTMLNAAEDYPAIDAFFAAKRNAGGANNPYANRMILLFAWGTGNEPYGGGASDIRSNFVRMPARVDGGTTMQGKPVPGWYMMAHEVGHHLGLQHTFPDGPRALLEAVAQGYPLNGLTTDKDGNTIGVWGSGGSADYGPVNASQTTKDNVAAYLNKYPYAFDQDQFDITDDTGKLVAHGVKDTGIDLGIGLAPLYGKAPCEAVSNITLGPLTGLDNATNRHNPMSYTLCPTSQLVYTPGQVKVMVESLARPDHALFVSQRTESTQVCKPREWKAGPGHVKPGDPVMRTRQAPARRELLIDKR